MTFQPFFPGAGYAGWTFLKRTSANQQKVFSQQAVIQKDSDYFRARIGNIRTAEDLVGDFRLLKIALTAYGLEADLPNKHLIQRVLEDGTLSPRALANRLSDKRYAELSKAFGFGDFSTPRTQLSDFADKLLKRFLDKSFQTAVGQQNQTFRLALNVESQLVDVAKSSANSLSKWYTVLGSPPLRAVFETAFGLPSAFGAIDLDKQVEELEARTRNVFGSDDIGQFTDSKNLEKLVRLFVIRSEVAASAASVSSGQIALSLLQQAVVQRF